MNKLYVAVLAIFLFLLSIDNYAQQRSFGLGIMLGEPSGVSAKLFTSKTTAFNFGIGLSIGGDRIGAYDGKYDGGSRIHFHADYLLHVYNAIGSTEQFPIYYGIGARINSGGGYSSSIAVRFVGGIAWMPRDIPIDLFIELVPSLQLTSQPGFAIDSAIGARYYF